jgi:small-conductance mechanosensitive channel
MTIKSMFRYIFLFSIFILIFTGIALAQEKPDSAPGPSHAEIPGINQLNPSSWLEQTENNLILIESKLLAGYDSSFMNEDFPRLISTFELISKDFNSRGEFMRLRSLDDTKAELIQLRNQVDVWRKKIARINSEISAEFNSLHKIKQDSIQFYIRHDSALWGIYDDMFSQQEGLVATIDSQCQFALAKFVGIEKKLNLLTYNISSAISAVDKRIKVFQTSFFKKTHPSVWELDTRSYPERLGTVFVETAKQNLESLKFYGKQAYVRAIFFRLFLLVITMLPVLFFKRQRKRKDFETTSGKYSLLHKYTGSAAASFGMVMAPFVFINAPHIVIEAIMVTLAITTSHIFLSENPGISKKMFYAVLVSYIILRFFNLLVSVTLFGRILWAFSILLCIPLYKLFFDINRTTMRNKLVNKVIILITILMILGGWILSITGHFPYGRILVISALDGFFLLIVLYVAIYAFIDFLKILADLYNSRNLVSQIRVDLIYQKLVNIVTFLAVAYWIVAFLKNVNAYDFLNEHITDLFSRSTVIAGYPINIGSILVFIIILYFAIYLSSLLNGLFYDVKRSEETDNKTNLGSFMLLLRLTIITAGFIIAMIVAGIDLNKINLIIGALGVGIGFGLQNIINNMVSGLILAFERPIYVGDIIEVDNVKGRVTDIGLRATTIDTMEGAEFIVPNGELISKKMKNWTLTSKNFKIEIQIMVSLDNNAEHVISELNKAIDKTKAIRDYPPPKVTLKEIKSGALCFSVNCWINDISKSGVVRNELLKNIHLSLQEGGITYPKNSEQAE